MVGRGGCAPYGQLLFVYNFVTYSLGLFPVPAQLVAGGYAGGVGYDTSSRGADDERVRVIFEAGLVTSVETREK